MPYPHSQIIEASATIARPVAEVFTFYRDFSHLPEFLGDVLSVETVDASTSCWTIQAPLKMSLRWTVKVTEAVENVLLRYETVADPGRRLAWEIHFMPGNSAGETVIREVMHAPLSPLGMEIMALFGKPAAKEVAANLHRLKQVLETGRVRDRSYAVPGKFGGSDPATG